MLALRGAQGLVALALLTPFVTGVVGPGVTPALAAVAPVTNPPIEETCGVDLTVVLDASGSVSQSHAVDDVREAADALLESLSNTNSTARVLQFASLSQQLAASSPVDDTTLGNGGVLRNAINGYYNPQPPRPSNVNIYSYKGTGSPTSGSSYSLSNSQIQYTNWDQSLDQAGQTTPELVVYVTDGDPTAFDFNKPGDPFDAGPPPDVAVSTDRSTAAAQVTLDRAVEEANQVKTNGSRMLAIGVGSALNNPASQNRLVQISGPQVVRDADLATVDSLNEVDVALVTDFKDLAQLMRDVVLQLCSPSLTIRKLAQSPDDASYSPASGWDMTVTPRVPTGTGFNWILPDTASSPSKTLTTDSNGFAQFQWEPIPAEADSAATVDEDLQAGYTAGRPGAPDYRCELRDVDGNVRVVEGNFADPANPSFDLDPIGQEIVTCTVYNSFDYAPDIALAKVNAPTEVRGDLDPPTEVTSTYTVTNPGNTPLRDVTVTDDKCGPARPVPPTGANVGDTSPANDLLDPGESWQFTCVSTATTSLGANGNAVNVVNTADVQGTDPTGAVVTDDATDDVDVFVPGIDLTKLVDGQPSVIVPTGTAVTYTYLVENTGNTPLGGVTLVDDTAPCEDPTRGADGPGGNNDNVLDVGETWNFSCTASPTEAVVNTAVVRGTPLNPVAGNAPFAGSNPDVTDADSAAVTTTNPGLVLTKDVDHQLVFPGTDVTYSYTAENTGTTDLRNDTGDPGWVTDNRCAPVQQVLVAGDNAGDSNHDDLLNPGETWQFTCSATINVRTINVATVSAQPVVGGTPAGPPLVRHAIDIVRVVRPDITLTKTALVPVVLDPDATPVSGPDVPTPRPAEYLYEVANTGTVPLAGVDVTDNRCSGVTFVDGDTDGDGNLDVDEVWNYTCTTALEREQATPPPGDESGLVTNTATASGTPFLPSDPSVTAPDVSDSDRAQVLVIQPGLSITKTASDDAVLNGDEVSYTVVVANTGDVALELLGPTDSKCAPLVYVSGDTNSNGLLDGANSAAPESWTYTCTRAIGLPVAPDTVDHNVATVTGIDPLGNQYEDTDSADVRVVDAAIALTKSVSKSLVPVGTAVSYEFMVTNAGQGPIAADDVLAQVRLGDVSQPANPSCSTPVLVAKEGGNQDDLLDRDPAETWRYTCSGTVTAPTTDVGVVRAIGGTAIGESIPVVDVAAAFVDTFHPGIHVEKMASPTDVMSGGTVTYTYEVSNTGDVPLAHVVDRISDDTCSPVTYVSGDSDGDGLLDTADSIFEDSLAETWVFTCSTTVSVTTTNTVVVEGSPADPGGAPLCGPTAAPELTDVPCDVNDSDKATVTVSGVLPEVLPGTGAPPGIGRQMAIGFVLVLLGASLLLHRRKLLLPG